MFKGTISVFLSVPLGMERWQWQIHNSTLKSTKTLLIIKHFVCKLLKALKIILAEHKHYLWNILLYMNKNQ